MRYSAIIIDDDLRTIDTVRALLNDYFPEVDIIGTAQMIDEGFKQIRKLNPDILFLDILMPRGNGYDLLERFPLRGFDVVVISGAKGKEELNQRYHIFEYVMKPIDIDGFKTTMQRLFEHRQAKPDHTYILNPDIYL